MLLKFCLATIGGCVFQCVDFGWRTFCFHRKFFKGEKHEKNDRSSYSYYFGVGGLLFCKLFKKRTGHTPKTYRNSYRLHLSGELAAKQTEGFFNTIRKRRQ